jgi:hypothetical protein
MGDCFTSRIVDAEFQSVPDQRHADRRAGDRRAPRSSLDTLFAATLVNHVARTEVRLARGYAPIKPGPRPGISVNLRA